MKYLIFLTYLVTSTSWAFIGQEAMNLMNNQTFVNDDIIHNESQNEIKQDYLSENTLKLIESNEKLKENLVLVENAIESKKVCDEDGEKKKKKKKKKI